MPTPNSLVKPLNPIINWGDPLTKGLVFDDTLSLPQGMTFENYSLTNGVLTAATHAVKNLYNAIQFSGTTHRIDYTNLLSNQNGLNDLTIQLLLFPNSVNTGVIVATKGDKTNATSFRWKVQLDGGTHSLSYTPGFGAGGGGFGGPTSSLVAGVWNNCFITNQNCASTSTIPVFYTNGVTGSNSFNVAPTGSIMADTPDLIAGNVQAYNVNMNGYLALLRYWNRILRPSEIKELTVNPWRIYQGDDLPTTPRL